LALFAGAGGGILGGHLLGWRTVCAVEWEPYPASVLLARQNDGILPPFPIWDDVQTFDGKPWRGIVDVVSGGFPCQDISVAGGGVESMVSGLECGKRWQGLLARYDPDTHSLRTVQCSLLEDLNESLQTWPRWGLMQNGECWEQAMSAPPTKEKESGYWLTPSTVDIAVRSKESMIKRLEYRKKLGRNGVGAGCLSEQVEWSGNGNPIGYMTAEKLFPTPTTRDYKGARKPEAMKKTGRNPMTNSLPDAVENQGEDGKLNPMWVEWLMGWPLGWTELKPLGMDKFHKWQHLHGKF